MKLFEDPFFTFSFSSHRKIDRIHLEGIPQGTVIEIYTSKEFKEPPIRIGIADENSWVTLHPPVIVLPEDSFFAKPATA